MWGLSSQMWHKNQGRDIYTTPNQWTDARQTVRWRPEWDWKNAWLSFKRIYNDLLGNHKPANYQDVVQYLLTSYNAMECYMSMKIHFWSHTSIFSPRKSRRTQWKISPRHYGYGKAVPRQVNLKYVGRLLLDNEQRCTWRQIPASHKSLHLEDSFCLFH
jgi:hypothetical protein